MADLKNSQGFSTRAIHAGQKPDPTTGAVMTPIYATSTYAQESPGVNKGYEYARGKNPTREAFEACIADLEGGVQAFGFGSGMAATSTALELLDAGSHIVTGDDLYGGSWRLFERVRRRSMGLDFSYIDLTDLKAVEAAITDKTRMLWVETPTNPLMKLADIEALSKIAKAHKLLLVVDNTFATLDGAVSCALQPARKKLCALAPRPHQAETRAAEVGATADVGTPAVPVDDPPHDGQPQAMAAGGPRAAVVQAQERREHPLPGLFRHARAIVLDVDPAALRINPVGHPHA